MSSSHYVNICFHGLGVPKRDLEAGEDAYWISGELFRDVLDMVRDRQDVRISFDDGNASDAEIALPELVERSLHATFFPLASRIGAPGSLDRDGLQALSLAGMSIGSHGMWHKPWRGMTDEQLDEELVLARKVITDETGHAVDTAACPLGSYDRRVLSRLRSEGYVRVFTSDRSRSTDHAWLQPRFSVRKVDDFESVRRLLDAEPNFYARRKVSARIAVKRWR